MDKIRIKNTKDEKPLQVDPCIFTIKIAVSTEVKTAILVGVIGVEL